MQSRSPKSTTALLLLSLLPFTAAALSSGCRRDASQAKTNAAPTPAPTPAGPKAPDIDYAKVRPNELGVIPVIMYHEFKEKNASLTRSTASFKQDLEVLRKNNFYPVNLSDVLNNRIDVPAGKSPVVLTFDDARETQFRLIETPDALKVDPKCAVGILEAFNKEHEDWPLRATFFVLPKSKVTQDSFGQLGMGAQKMQYLVEKGMELGNHSTYHKSMRNMTPEQIQAEIGNAHKVILEQVPNAKIQVVALPMGQFPRNKANWKYLLKGTYQGVSYDYKAAMDAAWRPIYSPASKQYNHARLERIDSIDGLNGIRDWVNKLSTAGGAGGMLRYISDGDPNVISYPKGNDAEVNVALLKSQRKLANAYSPFGTGGGSKPIVGLGTPKRIIDPSKEDEGEKPIVAEYNVEGSASSEKKVTAGGP